MKLCISIRIDFKRKGWANAAKDHTLKRFYDEFYKYSTLFSPFVYKKYFLSVSSQEKVKKFNQ